MLCYAVTQSCPTLCHPMDCGLPDSSVHEDSLGKNTGVGCLSLLQGIFPTQGSNPHLPHCWQILYQLSHKGSPRKYMGTGRTPALWERKACAPNLYNAPPAGGPIGFLPRWPREDTCCPSQPRPIPKPVVRSGPGRVVALPFSPLTNLHPGRHPGRCSGTDHAGPPTFPVPVQGVPAHPLHPQDPVATPRLCLPFFFRPRLAPGPQVLHSASYRVSLSKSWSPVSPMIQSRPSAKGQSFLQPGRDLTPALLATPNLPSSFATSQPFLGQNRLPDSESLVPTSLSGSPLHPPLTVAPHNDLQLPSVLWAPLSRWTGAQGTLLNE